MYSNICENIKCSYNPKTDFCNKISKDKHIKPQKQACFCNHETGRCIKAKRDKENENKIITPRIIKINETYLTDVSLIEGILEGYGKTYLKSIKKCYPLPPKSQLTYGVLKKTNKFVAYNKNYYYYPIEKKDKDLIIYLDNYKILIKSLKKCSLIRL